VIFDKNISEKDFQKFLLQVSKLDALEFLGLVRIFNIEIFKDDEKKTPREFEELLSDVLDMYVKLDRKQRRTIMKTIKLSNLGKIEG
jgi:hypothetical protein